MAWASPCLTSQRQRLVSLSACLHTAAVHIWLALSAGKKGLIGRAVEKATELHKALAAAQAPAPAASSQQPCVQEMTTVRVFIAFGLRQ